MVSPDLQWCRDFAFEPGDGGVEWLLARGALLKRAMVANLATMRQGARAETLRLVSSGGCGGLPQRYTPPILARQTAIPRTMRGTRESNTALSIVTDDTSWLCVWRAFNGLEDLW